MVAMRPNVRSYLVAAPAAAVTAAALAILQPWLTHWLDIFDWDSPFCGSADGGEESALAGGWTFWWTATAIITGTLVGWSLSDRRTRTAVTRHPLPHLGIVAAATLGSLMVLVPLHGLHDISDDAAGRYGSCIYMSGLMADMWFGLVLGAMLAVVAVAVPEFAIGLIVSSCYVWACNLIIAIDPASTGIGGTTGVAESDNAITAIVGRRANGDTLSEIISTVHLPVLMLLAWWLAQRYRGKRLLALIVIPTVILLPLISFLRGIPTG